jgi:hypothetical protein
MLMIDGSIARTVGWLVGREVCRDNGMQVAGELYI